MTATAFDLEDLPDALSQSEAFWMLNTLAYASALREAYRIILEDPKSRADWTKICELMERAVNRQYPTGEARYLIDLAYRRGLEGAKQQKEIINQKDELNGNQDV
jgi:hypothetical protein